MDNVKDAILRVSRRVRALDKIAQRRPRIASISNSQSVLVNVQDKKPIQNYIPLTNDLLKTSGKFKNHERKKFQEFLDPLNLPDLKINESKPFDTRLARENWKVASSTDNLMMYKNFVDNQSAFNQVLELLIELTPDDLKGDRDEFTQLKVIQDYEDSNSKYSDIPKFYFKPIPPLAEVEDFNRFIYLLTHSKIYNQETTSSLNGLVNDILLYTHKFDNQEYKHKRNVDTFNNLIKYYGFDKNQSIFSRTLLLVMEKEGILPNIETFNNLLKVVIVNSQIRSTNTNKFKVILKYLKLIKHFNLQANLMTWQRIYSCINNIYLKEQFLNKMSLINLPVTNDLSLKIIDDYMKYCTTAKQLQDFIENDLNHKAWQHNDKIANKMIYFKIITLGQFPTTLPNEFSRWHIFQGVSKLKTNAKEKVELMLKYYEPDFMLINTFINTLSESKTFKPEYQLIINKLAYDFIELSGQDFAVMKKFNKNLNLIQEKMKYLKLTIEPQDYDITKIELTDNELQIPERLMKTNKIRMIKMINQNKLHQFETSIDDRLRQSNII